MHVSHLTLHDFRSYPVAEVPLEPGVTAFVGRNGQGKTNLVEAVDYLSRLSSHRVASDAPLVRGEALAMRCRPCGCVANAHGIWHLVAILSIVLTAAAREYGLLVS